MSALATVTISVTGQRTIFHLMVLSNSESQKDYLLILEEVHR